MFYSIVKYNTNINYINRDEDEVNKWLGVQFEFMKKPCVLSNAQKEWIKCTLQGDYGSISIATLLELVKEKDKAEPDVCIFLYIYSFFYMLFHITTRLTYHSTKSWLIYHFSTKFGKSHQNQGKQTP